MAFRHDHAVLMDRVSGIGRCNNVPGPDDREHQVRQRVLGPDGHDRLVNGIERHAVISGVSIGDGSPKLRDTLRKGVAMISRVAGCFEQLVDNGPRRGAIGIAHAQVDNVQIVVARARLHLIDDCENVGRELIDPVELVRGSGHELSSYSPAPRQRLTHPRRQRLC